MGLSPVICKQLIYIVQIQRTTNGWVDKLKVEPLCEKGEVFLFSSWSNKISKNGRESKILRHCIHKIYNYRV